ncbi:MAG TPA: hypothetical protein VEI98_06575 [Xanthobacteraceae bacterium]|nr:hypothetical protein [Xanthobacteraceae bacterium]
MFELVTYDGSGHVVRHDLDALKLPNGDMAHMLRQDDLWKALLELEIEGIGPNTGRQALLLAYSRWLKKQKASA